jgi:DNA (cytosine-5)-methyltransferase 1
MKILNLYAGIGGNRKLWGDDHDITAVELDPDIAKIYQDFFPKDKVIIADAHQYLLEHYQEFDFIWSSPPCPSHSMLRKHLSMSSGAKAIYPDMKLYEEILFLKHYFKGDWVVENVKPYYEPLIKPQILQRHCFWSNKEVPQKEFEKDNIRLGGRGCKGKPEWIQIEHLQERHQIFLPETASNKRTLLRNCVCPELGKHILDEVLARVHKKSVEKIKGLLK